MEVKTYTIDERNIRLHRYICSVPLPEEILMNRVT